MINNNIDVIDAEQGSNFPFTFNSSLELNGVKLSSDLFEFIKIYCSEDIILPCSIIKIMLSPTINDCVEITFGDAIGKSVGTLWIHATGSYQDNDGAWYMTGLIHNEHRVLKGFASYSTNLYYILRSCVDSAKDNTILIDNDFVLLPICCIPRFKEAMSSISAGGRTTCSNVSFCPGEYTRAIFEGTYPDYTYAMSIIDKYKPTKNGICDLHVPLSFPQGIYTEDLWVGGMDMILKHTVESNIRVTKETDPRITKTPVIQIQGVLDSHGKQH